MLRSINLVRSIAIIGLIVFSGSVAAEQIPVWEGIRKTTAQKKADKAFVESVRKVEKGNSSKGVSRAIQLGWQFVARKQPEMAIKRFNQAWLLSPNHPDIFWGFAVSTHLQGKPLAVRAPFSQS